MPYTDYAAMAAAEASGGIAMFDLVQAEHPGLWDFLFQDGDVLPFMPF
jgi:exonuclease I